MNWGDEFEIAMAALPKIVQEPTEYRIHYNNIGEIYMCTMQQHPADTTYLVVTKEEYDNYFRYTVAEGKLKKIDTNPGYRIQLKKSTTGYQVVKDHAGLVLESGETYANTEYYDTNN